ncbi:F-box domain containing protein [Parasponia andersonii]|uniref:F-box domain containing protein n=1 Tax=Parasponia andersonii TaxID=3476 RepID=A0A2P5DEC4_PARAD|nr:F-box domain containing protein [Parasponia andersonii]
MAQRKWQELPNNATFSILSRLGSIDVLMSAQFVCKSWYRVCKDPRMWRTIDMRNNGDPAMMDKLEDMCRAAVDRSDGQLEAIDVEHFGDSRLLKYVSDRSRQLKRLRYAHCDYVADRALIAATAKLPLLEELDLTLCLFTEKFLINLGSRCPRLTTLKLNCQFYRDPDHTEAELNEEALAIAQNLPELRHLQIVGNPITNTGFEAILNGCRRLESLDLRRCLNLNLDGELGIRCIEEIAHVRLPHDSIEDYGYPADPANPTIRRLNEADSLRLLSRLFLDVDHRGQRQEPHEDVDGGGDDDDDEFDYNGYSTGDDSLGNNDFAYHD